MNQEAYTLFLFEHAPPDGKGKAKENTQLQELQPTKKEELVSGAPAPALKSRQEVAQ